ncbi:carboxypeptidase-like regulatory domain-containing protein [Cesiribacter sp. SM1]|uniref:carboxypeptidase-like regulatory domain-containing protein n=1 Tax=Cesiribacter sp. SM1 TaxID=2861196 RepID=UPI001CD79BB2|nr:carboxypeptidase-like regulatory domain-containing protein [Cesiribacter sp. SM1]
MKKALLLSVCFCLLASATLLGQDVQKRIVSGVLLSPQGEPLPGVSIVIKGTTTGTVTDMEGAYRIEAPLGAVLVYSFIGYSSYEVRVTEKNSAPVGGQRSAQTGVSSGTVQDSKSTAPASKRSKRKSRQQSPKTMPDPGNPVEERGVAVLSDSAAGFKVLGNNNLYQNRIHGPLAKIRFSQKRNEWVLVPSYYARQQKPHFRLEFSTALSSSIVNRLPALQDEYAQGRAVEGELVARDPAAGDPHSWGPPLQELSYDGSGKLIPRQQGMQAATAYNPYDAFRTGFATNNRLQLFTSIDRLTFKTGYSNKFSSGTLPVNSYQHHALDFSANAEWGPLQPRLFISYSGAREKLPLRGANGAAVLGSLYTTPPTFDLMNGSSFRKPWNKQAAYLNGDGSQRSFAPGLADHPYWLLNTLPDQQEEQKALYGMELMFRNHWPVDLQYNLLLDKAQDHSLFGIPPGAAGATAAVHAPARLTDRRLNTTALTSSLNANYTLHPYNNSWNADFLATYNFSYDQQELNRFDGAGFSTGAAYSLDQAAERLERISSPYRRTHEIITKGMFHWNVNGLRIAQMAFSNQIYISNTLAPDNSRFFLPTASLSFNLHQLELFRYSDFLSELRTYATYASTLREAPLLYNQWHFNSLQYTPESYRQYYETEELFSPPGLLPEQLKKWEAGVDAGLFRGRLNLQARYFFNITDQLLVPVFVEGQYQLKNSAKLISPGLEVALKTHGYFSDGRWEAGATFSRSRPYVKELYHGEESLPIAGFSTISTNLIEGEPYGVLWGSRFSRNNEGQLVIGRDGFPIVDAQAGIIGNPNPNWLGSVWGTANMGSFGFAFALEVKKGGDSWNGTQQFLNYYGRSQYTAEQRHVRGYIFTGVNEEGAPNRQPVDFYNPANAFAENRWVRYGAAGVAEEAVEDASWLRLNEIQFSYQLKTATARRLHLQRLKLALIARNLFVLTNYSGIDPAGSLFGYQQAAGLDLFNQPNVKSYGFSLTLNL